MPQKVDLRDFETDLWNVIRDYGYGIPLIALATIMEGDGYPEYGRDLRRLSSRILAESDEA